MFDKILKWANMHNKKLPGNDHYHAMDKNDLIKFKDLIEKIHILKGSNFQKKCLPSEEISRKNARRSIVAKRDLSKGEFLNEENIICKRPGTGINPLHWDSLIGSKINKDIPNDQLLKWEDIV